MTYDDGSDRTTKDPDDELLERAKRCFKLVTQAEDKQRKREIDDLRFQVPENQWDDDARRARQGTTVSGVPTPPRPILSISKLEQPIRIVTNQERNAHLGVNIHPLTADADDDTAEVFQGLYRQIERDSPANQARSWAFDRAVKCGRGCYRVNTVFDETSDNPLDQKIVIERILYQDSVYFDPAAQKPDYSDAEWALVVGWMSLETFKREFPDATQVPTDDMTFKNALRNDPDWVREEGDSRGLLVAEYFYKTHELVEVGSGPSKRKRDTVSVKWCKLTGFEVLEQGDWNGRLVPLIPVLGRELQPFDNERRWQGIIGPNKDAQRVFNYAASNAIELVALEPRAPFIGTADQIEGYEDEWQQANIRNFPVLRYNPHVHDGQLIPPPQRSQVDVGRLGPTMALLQQAEQFLQAGTATYDPSLGRGSPREKSGRAIGLLQQQAEAGTSDYLANLADISLAYEARVVLDLIPAIYDRPGRLTRVLDAEGKSKPVMLNQKYYEDPQSGRPVPLGPGMQPPPMNGTAGAPPAEVKHHDLSKGVYSVSVTIGRSRQTAIEQGAEELGAILEAQPQLMTLLGSIYFRFRDFPGHQEIADLLAKLRDKQFPGLNDDAAGPSPEQAQQQITQLQQQLQLVQAQLQQAIEAVKTDQAKQQAMIAKAQMDNASRERIAALQADNERVIAEFSKKFDALQALLQHTHEADTARHDSAHKVALAAAETGHDIARAAAMPKAPIAPANLNPAPQSVGMPLGPDEGEV